MRNFLFILLFFVYSGAYTQNDSMLIKQSMLLHRVLVANDGSLGVYLDEDLSYGHSNGWIETREQMIKNLQSGVMRYNSIREDSITSSRKDNTGYVRFWAEVNVTLNGTAMTLKLKVLEVWVKKRGAWKLYARQAVRVQT